MSLSVRKNANMTTVTALELPVWEFDGALINMLLLITYVYVMVPLIYMLFCHT